MRPGSGEGRSDEKLACISTRRDLSAEGEVPRGEHKRFLRLCELGEKFALHLHAKPNRKEAEAVLRKILIGMGHVIENDGSIFDCAIYWQAAKSYRRTGRLSVTTSPDGAKASHTTGSYFC